MLLEIYLKLQLKNCKYSIKLTGIIIKKLENENLDSQKVQNEVK